MPIFERPPIETLSMVRDRWTPIYLEHGRLEVDDSSVKWISSQKLVCRIPVATVSALILGPGTTITHAAVKACAESNTPLIWMGEEGMHFYSAGLQPNHDNSMARTHASVWGNRQPRDEVARRMCRFRLEDTEVDSATVAQLPVIVGKSVEIEVANSRSHHGYTYKSRC